MVLLMYLSKMEDKIRRRIWFAIFLTNGLLFLLVPALQAKPSKVQSLAGIKSAITQFVNKQFTPDFKVSIVLGKLDPHLRLSNCPKKLDVFYPALARKMGATTIGVQCLTTSPWKIHLPVQIRVFGPAVVSKQALPRGTILSRSDLKIAPREISTSPEGYYKNINELVGMELRVSQPQGRIIGPRSIKPRFLVKRGDIVTVIAETKGLLIQIKGKALMDGYKGQFIRIKNTRSKRVLQAEVIAARTVKVKL